MRATVLQPADPAWSSFLETVAHDTYHLPGYVAADARRVSGEPLAILLEEGGAGLLLPLILRPLPGGIDGTDAVSPYGYPGPLVCGGDERFLEAAGVAVRDLLSRMNCCAAFIRAHPLLPTPVRVFADIGTHRVLGPTVHIDLSLGEAERRAGMNRNCRRSVNQTVRAGYVASVDEDWRAFDAFLALYVATMDRAGAGAVYYFDRDYFLDLKESLGDHVHLITVSRQSDVVAAGLYLESGGIVQSHLSGSQRLSGKQSADRVMIHHAADWFAARGNRVFHLGGGLGVEEDGIFQFKAGFSPLRGRFSAWNLVTHQEIFDKACAAVGVAAPGAGEGPDGFFPAYRKP